MSKTTEKNLLPFAAFSQMNVGFDSDVEKATAFCTSELNREKGGGLFRKQDAEKLVFISKVYYPFWLVPFKEFTLLLDGLSITSHIIPYPELPDLKAFKENLNKRSITRQVHTNFLSNNQNYFKKSEQEQNLIIEGLLKEKEFITEFLNYTREAIKTKNQVDDAVLITPALNKDGVIKLLKNVEQTQQELLNKIADLNEIIKLLNIRKQECQTKLSEEIKTTEKEYSTKIQKIKSTVETKISKINKTYRSEETEISDKFEQQIKGLQKEIVKCEKTKEQLNSEVEHVEAEIRSTAINKDSVAEQKWKEKLNELQDNLPEMDVKIKDFQKQIIETEEARKNMLFQLKQDNDTKLKEANKDLVEVEAQRDAEIKVYQNEIEKIEELTSNIITKVDGLARDIEAVIIEFDSLGIKQKREENSLIYMPFYLSCYQSKSRKRYTYLSPSIVSYGGLGVKLKSLGKTKVTHLCQPRNKKIIFILNAFMNVLDENIVFNREISEACSKTNLLQIQKEQESVRSGLNKLKEQGWLSSSEFEAFNQTIS